MAGKTGTREWSSVSFNLASQDGRCVNGCCYCFRNEHFVRYGYRPRQKPIKKYTGTIMIPTRHDLTSENVEEAEGVLEALAGAGNSLLIVSKPRPSVIDRLCKRLLPYKGQVEFRFSIGSAYDYVLKAWEPGAPSWADRVASVDIAAGHGYTTSISAEPMLDHLPHSVIHLLGPTIERARGTIWLGLMNRASGRLKANGQDTPDMLFEAAKLERHWRDASNLWALRSWCADKSYIRFKDSIQKILGVDELGNKT